MARKIDEIYQEIIAGVQSDTVLSEELTSTSKTAIWRLTAYVVAVAIWTVEVLFDTHKAEVNTILATKQTRTLNGYANMAKAFQLGYELNPNTGAYNTIDESAMIIAQASVTERGGDLIMKVAKLVGGSLAPLASTTPDELTPFRQYIAKVKDAGVKVSIISAIGDDLRLVLDVFYDPLVLDSAGKLLSDGVTEPVRVTLKSFITSLPFNGEFIPASLVDVFQATEGVDIPVILSCETKSALNDWAVVDGKVIPNAGYLTIADEHLTINYRANV